MPLSRADAQAAGRVGGFRRAALATDPQSITQAANAENWELFRQRVREVMPEIAGDDVEVDRRAELLRKAEMQAPPRAGPAGGRPRYRRSRRLARPTARSPSPPYMREGGTHGRSRPRQRVRRGRR
jgi:hypothetical protein